MIHIEGFEQFANEDATNTALTRSGYTVGIGQWASVAGRGRFSRAIAGQGAALKRVLPWIYPNLSVGFAHQFSGRGSVCWIKVGDKDVTLSFDPVTGLPRLGTANSFTVGGAIPVINRWYYYEIHVTRDDGVFRLFINGKADSIYIAGPIGPGDTNNTAEINLGWRTPAAYAPPSTPPVVDNAVKNYDDFYAREATPLGPIMITTRFPSHDEVVNWQKAGDAPTHSATVGTLPAAPLDRYVATDQYNQPDTFSSSQQMSNDHPVIATGMIVLARRSPTFPAQLRLLMDGPLTDGRDAYLDVGPDWVSQYGVFVEMGEDSPDNIATSHFSIIAVAP